MNLNNALIKDFEGKTFKELSAAPVTAIQGVSDNAA